MGVGKVGDRSREGGDISAAESKDLEDLGPERDSGFLLKPPATCLPAPSISPRKPRKELESWSQALAGVCFHSLLLGYSLSRFCVVLIPPPWSSAKLTCTSGNVRGCVAAETAIHSTG